MSCGMMARNNLVPCIQIIQGDCLEVLPTLEADSVDSVVCDPPYGLGFMGKDWDHGVPGEHYWREVLRVAKPGAYLLAFGGTRTFHRLTCAIEDAGWQIRDCVMWLYGSGFPKSLDVSKAIDKAAGMEREVVGIGLHAAHRQSQPFGQGVTQEASRDTRNITAPATPEAQQWQGWGTALKPAWEPIIVARKPLIGTVAENVLTHGTGGINVDGCRVEGMAPVTVQGQSARAGEVYGADQRDQRVFEPHTSGRWPANLIHDGSEEVVAGFPVTVPSSSMLNPGSERRSQFGQIVSSARTTGYTDTGSAARFFYTAKASKADRDEGCEGMPSVACGTMEDDNYDIKTGSGNSRDTQRRNHHPTVKPTALMRYLCRLVTPPKGIVLDPFMGSGSTGKAAILEDCCFIGIEIDPYYCEIARCRLEQELAQGRLDLTG